MIMYLLILLDNIIISAVPGYKYKFEDIFVVVLFKSLTKQTFEQNNETIENYHVSNHLRRLTENVILNVNLICHFNVCFVNDLYI